MAAGAVSKLWSKHWGKAVTGGAAYFLGDYLYGKYLSEVERDFYGLRARATGREPLDTDKPPFTLRLVSSKHSGKGVGRAIFNDEAARCFQLAGIDWEPWWPSTDYAGHAKVPWRIALPRSKHRTV